MPKKGRIDREMRKRRRAAIKRVDMPNIVPPSSGKMSKLELERERQRKVQTKFKGKSTHVSRLRDQRSRDKNGQW